MHQGTEGCTLSASRLRLCGATVTFAPDFDIKFDDHNVSMDRQMRGITLVALPVDLRQRMVDIAAQHRMDERIHGVDWLKAQASTAWGYHYGTCEVAQVQ